jgi:hypothetical protein
MMQMRHRLVAFRSSTTPAAPATRLPELTRSSALNRGEAEWSFELQQRRARRLPHFCFLANNGVELTCALRRIFGFATALVGSARHP